MQWPRLARWGALPAPHSPGLPGAGEFPPGRTVALISLGDRQVSRRERGFCSSHDGAVLGRPATFQAPCAVCKWETLITDHERERRAPPNSSSLKESQAWTQRIAGAHPVSFAGCRAVARLPRGLHVTSLPTSFRRRA